MSSSWEGKSIGGQRFSCYDPSVKMAAATRIFISFLLILPLCRAQSPTEDPSPPSHMMLSPQSLISLLLLGLTVTLSGSVYLWILRYVCLGCCQPVAVGPETEALAVMV